MTRESTPSPLRTSRRTLLKGAAASIGALAAPALVRAQGTPKIRVGFWPVAAGLPFFAAVERGFFRDANLDVEPLKFAGAQQVLSLIHI